MTSILPSDVTGDPAGAKTTGTALAVSGLAALGIVFGDIGTSPLYTLKTVFDYLGGDVTPERILGILSLLIWTLFLVTSVKYVYVAMSIDNEGEGGILALMSLLGVKHHRRPVIIVAGLLGAALIYGDGAITPAISVLSALEGLNDAAPQLKHYVVPAAVVILAALFAVQPFGTSRIGAAFGPIMAIWFAVIGVLGLWGIAQAPSVLLAINPLYGLHLLIGNGFKGFLLLGGVFLCVTGAEALYADMGHFGRRPIRFAWSWVVFPCLVLNYAGQSAMALRGGAIGKQYFLQPLPGIAAFADGLPGHARHNYRQPIDHYRRFFHDPAGDPTWLDAAPAHQADLRQGLRPDLCGCRQLAPDGRYDRADDPVSQVRRSRRRLWDRCFLDDADDIVPPLHRHA